MRFNELLPNKKIDAEFIFLCFAQATGLPYFIHRYYRDGRVERIEDEPSHEFYPDGYARACRMNREIGISEEDAKIFRFRVQNVRRQRLEDERIEKERQEREAREAERKRVLDMQIEHGSPGQLSVIAVHERDGWERVADLDGSTWPASRQHIVRHKATGTLWSCRYAIRDDDSDAGLSQSWEEVEEKSVTVVRYEPKGK